MLWAILSILAALFWATNGIIDKFILTKWIKNPIIPVIILGIIGAIFSALIYLARGFAKLSYFNIGLALIAGIFYMLMIIFYFKAIQIEEVSKVTPLFNLSPLVILIFATIFLGEHFTILKYIGIFISVIGAVLLSSKNALRVNLGKPFFFMMLAVVATSINIILAKHLLSFADYWTIFSYIRLGGLFVIVPLIYKIMPEFIKTIQERRGKVAGIIIFNEILNLIGALLMTIALSIGFATLVSVVSRLYPFFVLLFAIIISAFYPHILKEELGTSTILTKLLATILIFAGMALII